MARCDRPAAVVVLLLCDVIGVVLGRECSDVGCCYNGRRTRLTCSFSEPIINVLLDGAPALEEAKITQGHKVFLKGDAVANNYQLRSLLFSDIRELNLEGNSEIQVEANRAVSLTVIRVGDLRLSSSAFHGWQSDLATLSIAEIENVVIELGAFPSNSGFRRVRLSNITTLTLKTAAILGKIGQLELENVRHLQLNPRAIRGVVETLSLLNVHSDSCPPQAIGGSVGVALLRSSTFSEVESRCLDAGVSWQNLTLSDSSIAHLSPHSIYGTIGNISISGCHIGGAGLAALSVEVTHLSLSNTTVGELAPRALQVEAAESVTLRRVNVSFLRRDALSDLRVTNATGGGGGIAISGLTVRRAEPGSLSFADGAQITLTNLLLTDGCVCGTPSWAGQLVSSNRNRLSSSTGLAGEHGDLMRQVEAGLCIDDGDTVSLADFIAQRCGSVGSGNLSGQPPDQSAPAASGWFYLGVICLAVLLLVVTTLLAIIAVRCFFRRRKRRSDRPGKLEPESAMLRHPEPPGRCETGLCLVDGPAAISGQNQGDPSCRLVLSRGTADGEPEALYSELGDYPTDSGHPEHAEIGQPGGPSRQESLYVEPLGADAGEQVAVLEPSGHSSAEMSDGRGDGGRTGHASAEPPQDIPDYAEIGSEPADEHRNTGGMVYNQLYGSAV